MLVLGIALFVVAIVCAWPLPIVLERFTLKVEPGTLIILWQATGLAGGLSLIGAAGFVALAPLSRHIPMSSFTWVNWVMLAVSILVLVRLVWALLVSLVRTLRWRARHRAHVAVLSRPCEEHPDTRVVDSHDIVAYCIPGRGATTVISTGLLSRLSPPEQLALLAHERAHLCLHHDLVILPFAAWQHALPFLPATSVAFRCVTALTEFMADDYARLSVPAPDLAQALHTTGGDSALTTARLARIDRPVRSPWAGLFRAR